MFWIKCCSRLSYYFGPHFNSSWLYHEFTQPRWVNSLAPGKFEWNFRYLIFWIITGIDVWGTSCELALRWMSLDLTDDKSTLVQVMAWCRQATSHYLSQCWPRFLSPYGITRPQWVKFTGCIDYCSTRHWWVTHVSSYLFKAISIGVGKCGKISNWWLLCKHMIHEDIMTLRYFQHYWPIVGYHQSPVVSSHKEPIIHSFVGVFVNSSPPGQNGRHFADDISDAFSWMKSFLFLLKCHWSLFLRVQLTVTQHWFR